MSFQNSPLSETLIILLFLSIWAVNFGSIYGWLMDNRSAFIKVTDVVSNWRNVFFPWDAFHAFFFLISYFPIASKFCVPSFEVPSFGASTCSFRFTIAYVIGLHAVIVASIAVLFRMTRAPFGQRTFGFFLAAIMLILAPSHARQLSLSCHLRACCHMPQTNVG